MKLKRRIRLFLLLVSVCSINVFSQTTQIENVQFYFDNNLNVVIISYDFSNYSEFETYQVELTFKDGNNQIINPVSVSGDIGKEVIGGENKKIIWDIFNDEDGLPQTASPVIIIASVATVQLDPSLALIMNKIDKSSESRYDFKFKRDGLLLIGAGSGISAIVFKLKADGYIDQQNMSANIDEYNIAGENADSFYTMSKIAGAISLVSVSYALYQYIWSDKPQRRNNDIVVSPTSNNGVLIAWTRNF